MNSALSVIFLGLCLCIGTSSAFSCPASQVLDRIQAQLSNVGYQIGSTFRVVRELCVRKDNTMTEKLAQEFFNCYDAAPAGGKELYTKCQIKINGKDGLMNSVAGIEKTCKSLYTFPLYTACLAFEFKKAGVDLSKAITDVNKCEEKLLGLSG